MLNKRERAGIVVIVILFVIAAFFFIRPESPKYPPFVSMSPAPAGVKGLYVLMEESGINVKSWRRSWSTLPDANGHALIVIEPGQVAQEERERLLAWIERGNDVIWLEQHPEGWTEALDHRALLSETAKADISRISRVEDVTRSDSRQYEAVIHSPFRIADEAGFEPLLRDEYGTIAARLTIGEGTLSLFVVPRWMQNETILEHHHFELLWPHLKQPWDAVWFDDYHHGYRDAGGFINVYPDWMLALFIQLVLAVLLWLYAGAIRFGPAYTPREWKVRRGDETMLAAASWYERKKLTKDAIGWQRQFVRELIRERWGVGPEASEQQVLAAARANADKKTVEQLAQLLQRWENIDQLHSYPPKMFFEDSRLADEIIRNLMRK